jgi:hypothetical protein
MVVTCLLLGISGGIRYWRDWQFQALADAGAICPFPLSDLPKSLGSWQEVVGSQSQLDPEVAQIAGTPDNCNISREYVDEKSGDRVSTLVLYGLASKVFAHSPDVCYPSQGYRLVLGPEDRPISFPGLTRPVLCRVAIYAKKVGPVVRYEEAYYTFFHNGQWLPDLGSRWKSFRAHPSTFKIQLGRSVSRLVLGDSRVETLICELAQEIDKRASADPTGGAKSEATSAREASRTPAVQRGGKSG